MRATCSNASNGDVVFALTLAQGLWSYRVSKAVLVDGQWVPP
jgi:hypothetical protein